MVSRREIIKTALAVPLVGVGSATATSIDWTASEIEIPAGTITLDAPIIIPSRGNPSWAGVRIRGENQRNTILRVTGAFPAIIADNTVIIENVRFEGPGDGTGVGVFLRNTGPGTIIRDCVFELLRWGIQTPINGTEGSSHCTQVDHCCFNACWQYGIWARDNNHDLRVRHSRFTNGKGSGRGMRIDYVGQVNIFDCLFVGGATPDAFMEFALEFKGSHGAVVHDCAFEGIWKDVIRIDGTSEQYASLSVAGSSVCFLTNDEWSFVRARYVDSLSVHDNYFTDSAKQILDIDDTVQSIHYFGNRRDRPQVPIYTAYAPRLSMFAE